MRVRLLAPAEEEMVEAAAYYESRVPTLGTNFLDIIEAAVAEISEHPERWPEVEAGVRRRVVRRFPYSLIYTVGNDEVCVLAVMHHKQKPRYWIPRL